MDSIFSNYQRDNHRYKYCKVCNRTMRWDYDGDTCPACIENELFSRVRDYVRTHEANEYDVSAHFKIPISQVRNWIKAGRMEYKEQGSAGFSQVFCSRCGEPVSFGTLCPKCLKLLNRQNRKGVALGSPNRHTDKMRFLDEDTK